MRWLDLKVPPPVIGAALATAMWAIADLGPQIEVAVPVRYALSGLLIVLGISFDVLGLLAFRSLRTTINPLRPEHSSALATGGIYKITRNPMYVGMALLLLAWLVYLSSLPPLAGPLLFIAYITRFQIEPEERVLQQLFGDEFISYASRVRRWL